MPQVQSRAALIALVMAATAAVAQAAPRDNKLAARPAANPPPVVYADDFSVLSPAARDMQRSPAGRFSYCLRSTATYDCLAYGQDGTVRHKRHEKTAHGTAFAYRRSGGDTFLATNEHVVTWPLVTSDDTPVDDVPMGCKRIDSGLRIVTGEGDRDERDDVPLTLVLADSLLDVAVLRTRAALTVMPYPIGRSANLKVGNVVTIQGYPLGVMETTNTGKVINTADHDTANDRDHLDFVVDAPLSPGNSGSPVLAVSKSTGRLELVGIFHAGYARGEGLNVVVAIDQVLDLMMWLRKSTRPEAEFDRLGAVERRDLSRFLRQSGGRMLFGVGSLTACAHLLAGGELVFELFDKALPLTEDRLLLLVDEPETQGFGRRGPTYFGARGLLYAADDGDLGPDVRSQLQRIHQRLRVDAVWTMRWRAARFTAAQERDQRALERWRHKNAGLAAEAATAAAELVGKLQAQPGQVGRTPVALLAELHGLPQAATPSVK
ncbi:MAG: serine protease [Deltaproteobacteria bacterium]|nr:serine protease [Deltaproteobacteria bacterium]